MLSSRNFGLPQNSNAMKTSFHFYQLDTKPGTPGKKGVMMSEGNLIGSLRWNVTLKGMYGYQQFCLKLEGGGLFKSAVCRKCFD